MLEFLHKPYVARDGHSSPPLHGLNLRRICGGDDGDSHGDDDDDVSGGDDILLQSLHETDDAV
ncbi:hypothetical protein ACWHAM_03315 [Paenibacillus terrae]